MQKSRKRNNASLWLLASLLIICANIVSCAPANFSPENDADNKTQTPSSEITDNHTVLNTKPLSPVDILFVIDNSRSMLQEQKKLAERLDKFIGAINGVDWQIAMTTTDVSEGPFATKGNLVDLEFKNAGTSPVKNKKLLDRNTQNFKRVFLDSINKYGTPKECEDSGSNCPSGYEQPMKATYKAVQKRKKENAGFFRDSADLAVIIVSDEDEETENGDLITPFLLKSFVELELGKNKKFNVYGIIYRPNDQVCLEQDQTGGRFGINLNLLIQLTKGISVSICEPDYSQPLTDIGKKVTQTPYEMILSQKPKQDTIKLNMQPAQPDITWHVEGQKIVFSDWPLVQTKIQVVYEKSEPAQP